MEAMKLYHRYASSPVRQSGQWMTLLLTVGLLVGTEATYSCTSQTDTDGASGCECIEISDDLTLSCDRIALQKLPVLNQRVTQLDLFRLVLNATSLHSEVLIEASALKLIRIESCELTSIENQSFTGLYSLEVLNLAYNRLTSLPTQLFADLNLLLTLDLSYNSLTHLKSNAFKGLQNLKTLDLSYNKLHSLPADLLLHLPSLKTLRLQDSLQNIDVIPLGMFDNTPQLETLLLQDNRLTSIQISLFNRTKGLLTVNLMSNQLTSISNHVFDGLTRLESLQLAGNPLNCDCRLKGYRDWLQELWRRNWLPETTGTCSQPAHLRGRHVTTLPTEQFYCYPNPSTEATSSTSRPYSGDDLITQSQQRTEQPTSILPTQTSDFNQQLPQEWRSADKKQKERGIIIGCSIAAAIFLIAGNILVIVCIKRSRKKRATKKIKYILRPEDVNPGKDQLDDDTKKNVRVEEAGYGYTISNGFSGIYHTGSVHKLHSNDTAQQVEQEGYNTENNETEKRHDDNLYRENSIPRSLGSHHHHNSMSRALSNHGIAMLDYSTEQPLTVDRLNYTYPCLPDQLPEIGGEFYPYQERQELPNQHQQLEFWHPQSDMCYTQQIGDFTEEPAFLPYAMHDGMPSDGMTHINPEYLQNSDYLIKDSLGSADSGVDSNSPLPPHHVILIDDTSTPNKRSGYSTLPTRQSQTHRLPSTDDTEYSSQSLKRVRSETYV